MSYIQTIHNNIFLILKFFRGLDETQEETLMDFCQSSTESYQVE